MTEEAQQIKIAETCGYEWGVTRYHAGYPEAILFLKSKYKPRDWWDTPEGEPMDKDGVKHLHLVPDYLNSLDAMRQAEKWMEKHASQFIEAYDKFLIKEFGPRAEARQRARGFLKVLGLWKEEKDV